MHYSGGFMNNNLNKQHYLCRRSVALAISVVVLWANSVQAETMYVTDMLQLELYGTMDMNGRSLKRLRSGDSMEVLHREGRIARVQLPDGATGWVKSLYLVDKEPARTRVNKIEKEAAAALEKASLLEKKLADREAELQGLQSTKAGSEEQKQAIQVELESLRINNQDLQSRLGAYAGSVPVTWFMFCLVVALACGFIGGWYFIDSRSRARHGGYRIY
jgi:SH3 domain protein